MWGAYDILGSDPNNLKSVIKRLEEELAEERHTRHDLELTLERAQHRNRHLERNVQKLEETFALLSPRGLRRTRGHQKGETFDEEGNYSYAVDGWGEGERDKLPDSENFSNSTAAVDLEVAEASLALRAKDRLVQRVQSRARHLFNALKSCQAERDDLKKQSVGDARVKEFLDEQLSRLESQIRRLRHENGDLKTQVEADAKMKEYLAKEWESVRTDMESLRMQLSKVTRQRDDILVQTKADQTTKEYLSRELERYEQAESDRASTSIHQIGGRYG